MKRAVKVPVLPVPAGHAGQSCDIIFGHNAAIKKVLLKFAVSADQFVFDPDDARHVARQLLFRADMADGVKTQG